MTKITRNESPSQQVLAKAMAEATVTDSAGRKITLRKPAFLAQFRLVEVAGESASNTTFMSMIHPLLYISAIDGVPVSHPTNKKQLDALIAELDEHGFEAMAAGIIEHFAPKDDPEGQKAELKK